MEGGIIARIGPQLPSEGARAIDCSGQFLTPGLCNLHAHTPMNIFKGIAEDVNIDDWFNRELWPYESKITDEDIYWGSKLAIAEMAQNGVTAFADHYFGGPPGSAGCGRTSPTPPSALEGTPAPRYRPPRT